MFDIDVELSFREAVSIALDLNDVQFNRVGIALYNKSNKLSEYFKTCLTNLYEFNFADNTDKGVLALPFFEWNSDSSSFTYEAPFVTLCDYIFTEFGDSNCMFTKDAIPAIMASTYSFFNNLLNKFIATWDKYSNLYNAYQANKNKLMASIKSSYEDHTSGSGGTTNANVSKFKDTPQGEVSLEDLDDDYNTNVNVGEGTTHFDNVGAVAHTAFDERDTLVTRLKEIEDKMSNLLESYAKEFKELFWEV